MPVYAELVKDYPVQYVAGGATLNSIRVAKWMMQQEGSAAYMGCISTDEFGCTMEASLAREARRMRAPHRHRATSRQAERALRLRPPPSRRAWRATSRRMRRPPPARAPCW